MQSETKVAHLHKLEEIRQDLATAISYSGGKIVNDLKFVDYCVYSA